MRFYNLIENIFKCLSRLIPKLIVRYYYTSLDLIDEKNSIRIPNEVVKYCNPSLKKYNIYFPCERVYFITDATKIIITVKYWKRCTFPHMSNMATSGIDVYILKNMHEDFLFTIYPRNNIQMNIKHILVFEKSMNREFILYLPGFAKISELTVFVPRKFFLRKKILNKDIPIVIYGSSITQGCAASRPSLSYSNILQRYLKVPVINFGFSESAKGEQKIIEYISNIKANIFILEYDHNASIDELKKTYCNVYETIRKKQKTSLIILLSRFSGRLSISRSEELERIQVIQETYNRALRRGEAVKFIRGDSLFRSINKSDYFVDDRHPNDAGMLKIAEEIIRVIKES